MSVGSFLCYTLPANMFRINVWFFRGSLMESPNEAGDFGERPLAMLRPGSGGAADAAGDVGCSDICAHLRNLRSHGSGPGVIHCLRRCSPAWRSFVS